MSIVKAEVVPAVEFRYYDGSAKVGFFGFDDSTGRFTILGSATNSSEVFSGTDLSVQAASFYVSTTEMLTSNGAAKAQSGVAGNGLQHSGGALYVDWVRDVFTSGSLVGSSYASVDGLSLAITSGLTATLTQTPLENDAVMVYLNGILQRPSASYEATASGGGYYDYKISSGVIRMASVVDSDAVLQVSYVKQ